MLGGRRAGLSRAVVSLAAAAVGTIGIADGDKVYISNLQRQIIHNNTRWGVRKRRVREDVHRGLEPGRPARYP